MMEGGSDNPDTSRHVFVAIVARCRYSGLRESYSDEVKSDMWRQGYVAIVASRRFS